MEQLAAGARGTTSRLRRLWLLGVAMLVVGLLVPGGGAVLAAPGVITLAAAAGISAARKSSPRGLLALAWAVPVVPTATAGGFTAWLVLQRSDPLAVYLFATLVGALVLATWLAFVGAFAVESARGRRRRFGAVAPAWKNDPTPPSYS